MSNADLSTEAARREYGYALGEHIGRRVRRVAGWHLDMCAMTGSLCLSDGGSVILHATPLWEGHPDLSVQLSDEDGRAQCFAHPIEWSGDLQHDCARWVALVSLVIRTMDCLFEAAWG